MRANYYRARRLRVLFIPTRWAYAYASERRRCGTGGDLTGTTMGGCVGEGIETLDGRKHY